MTEDGADPGPEISTAVPNSARIWNYWLGGTELSRGPGGR